MKVDTTPEERLLHREDISTHTSIPGQEYAYRPGVLLVDEHDVDLVQARLEEVGAKRDKSRVEGIAVYRVPAQVDLPDLVAKLRASSEERTPRVGPAHLLFACPRFRGWPGDDPEPAPALDTPPERTKGLPGSGVSITIIDTGLDAAARANPWLRDVQADDPKDIDLTVDSHPSDGFIDDQAGHAAFIAGIVRQAAPGASVRIIKALDTEGIADEIAVARAIDRAAGADIINLSLGGYTDGDQPPLAIVAALARLPRSTAVIAAAGNLASTRPTWPAALKRVVAVAAVDAKGNPATFSNSGWWVDTCAEGVELHSVFVKGRENPMNDPAPDTFDGHAFWSGTSFSCGRVSAAVAVEMAERGGTAREAASRLLDDPKARVVPELGVLVA